MTFNSIHLLRIPGFYIVFCNWFPLLKTTPCFLVLGINFTHVLPEGSGKVSAFSVDQWSEYWRKPVVQPSLSVVSLSQCRVSLALQVILSARFLASRTTCCRTHLLFSHSYGFFAVCSAIVTGSTFLLQNLVPVTSSLKKAWIAESNNAKSLREKQFQVSTTHLAQFDLTVIFWWYF